MEGELFQGASWCDIVWELKEKGADCNAVIGSRTLLCATCEEGCFEAVDLLLHCGADPNLAASENCPLSLACKRGHHKIVRLLLEHGADVHTTDKDNKTALYCRVESMSAGDSDPNLSILNLLLDFGADTNIPISSGETALYVACSKGLTAVVEVLLKHGAMVNVSNDKRSPLNAACKNQDITTVKLLLHKGADPNLAALVSPEEFLQSSPFALHIAVRDNCNELVSLLLSCGANVNVADRFGNTALHHVMQSYALSSPARTDAYNDNENISSTVVHTLLHAGANVNSRNIFKETPLYLAVDAGLPEFMDVLLSHGNDPVVSEIDKYLLCAACKAKNMPLVEKLLKAGMDPNSGIFDGKMDAKCVLPLFIAVEDNNCELAAFLLSHGADVNMLNSRGKSALHLSLERLFDSYFYSMYGPEDLEEYDKTNQTTDVANMAKFLLEHGADVNELMHEKGTTPLCFMIQQYNSSRLHGDFIPGPGDTIIEDFIEVVIRKGANLNDLSLDVEERNCLPSFCFWNARDHLSVELLKAGAGFELLEISCHCGFRLQNKEMRFCQAAVMAGYEPSRGELDDLQQLPLDFAAPESVTDYIKKVLSWLKEDSQQVPSLLRQSRVAIRRQLSAASHHCSILPAIEQLPLPECLQKYLKLEGGLSEVDLDVESN